MTGVNDLLGAGKVGTKLIDKMSSALGWIFAPSQIKRIAQANAEAAVIAATGQIRVTEMQHRAMTRLLAEEERKQANMEAITMMSLPHLEDSAKPADMEDDWIANFFDKCRLVSNKEMQELWARVLAGEANKPGAFSKRTVGILESLEKHDAESFSKLCGFRWRIDDSNAVIVVPRKAILENELDAMGVPFAVISQLETIGLIRWNITHSFSKNKLPNRVTLEYYGRKVSVDLEGGTDDCKLAIGAVLFTQFGHELQCVCQGEPNNLGYQLAMDYWGEEDVKVTPLA